jgi:predicted nucleotidyltransferase
MSSVAKSEIGQTLTEAQRDLVRQIVERHGGRNVRIFGSHARREAGSSSDVDLLVDMSDQSSLLDLIALKQEVEDELDMEVDIATEASLSRHIKNQVLSEAVRV